MGIFIARYNEQFRGLLCQNDSNDNRQLPQLFRQIAKVSRGCVCQFADRVLNRDRLGEAKHSLRNPIRGSEWAYLRDSGERNIRCERLKTETQLLAAEHVLNGFSGANIRQAEIRR